MSDIPDPSDGSTDRRTFLGFVGATAAGMSLPVTAEAHTREASGYVVEQGDTCIPVVPLGSEQTVEAFYDYRNPFTDPTGRTYSSHGTTDLQRNDTSILFLYEGPNGLSLVMVHDKLVDGSDGSTGGSVTFEFAGLPTDGEWVIKDDEYPGESNYDIWERSESTSTVDWTWGANRSDGGVFRGLTADSEVTLTPRFNGQATLSGDHYDGTVSEWHLLSGDAENPERTTLSMDEPITIRHGTCGTSTKAEVEVNIDVRPGENPVVNPRSSGRLPVAVTSTAKFDATTIDPSSIRFGPGEATPVRATAEDVTGDGRADLLLLFNVQALGVETTTDALAMTGTTTDGKTDVHGRTSIRIVPSREKTEEEKRERKEKQDERENERKEERKEEKEEWKEERKEAKEEWKEKKEEAKEEWEDMSKEERKEAKEEWKEEKEEWKEERKEEKEERKEEKEERKEERKEEKEERDDDDDDDEDDDDDDHGDDDDDDDDSIDGGFGISISLG